MKKIALNYVILESCFVFNKKNNTFPKPNIEESVISLRKFSCSKYQFHEISHFTFMKLIIPYV